MRTVTFTLTEDEARTALAGLIIAIARDREMLDGMPSRHPCFEGIDDRLGRMLSVREKIQNERDAQLP